MVKTPKFANDKVFAWVDKWNKVCTPDKIVVVKGTKKEHLAICEMMVKNGQFIKLNQKKRPECYLARSHESDVARVEGRTFICSKKEIDAGPTNHWMDPEVMKKLMLKSYKGCMKGRTMYVIPYAMGPIGNPITQYGIEITDSPYVVVNMNIMTRTSLHPLRRRSSQEGPEGRRVALREEDRRQVHHAVPRRPPDLVVRLGLRRERAPRQEVLCAPHRFEAREGPGLDGRAHAHPHAHFP